MFIPRAVLSIAISSALWAGQAADNTAKNKRDRDETAATAETQGNNKSDLDLLARIRRAITSDDSFSTSAHNIKIIVNEGKVILRGPVASEAERDRLNTLVKQMAGDNNVVNDLEIAKGDK